MFYDILIGARVVSSRESKDCPADMKGPEVVDWFVAGDESLDWEVHPSELDIFYAQMACKNANF